ncbi:MAG: GPW/gp25 family protein, partial [Gemmatimonadetes bacterium]|nr:GPW/gp25 family protein [Gemmatimonadota bacterium]
MDPSQGDVGSTSFLGRGWSFPPEFAPGAGGVLMSSDEEDIHESLKILFGTAAGERFLRPRYGLDMHEVLFEPMSTTLKTYLQDRIRTSILIYEPRVNLLSLELDTSGQQEGRVTLIVDYEVRATNSRFNLVYPFYAFDSSE